MSDAIKANTVAPTNQVPVADRKYFIGNENAKIKISVVGNSITFHGIKEEIGWTTPCGMAASDIDHDYVHVLSKLLEDNGFDCYMKVDQLSHWEVNYRDNITQKYSYIKDFNPDYFVFRLGENITEERMDISLAGYMKELIDFVTSEKTKVIMTTCFWKNDSVDDVIRKIAKERNYPVVELNDLGEREDMKAIGLFDHSGVSVHPGDKGMAEIAKRIYSCIKKCIEEN